MSTANVKIPTHPDYDANVFVWRRVRDFVEGEAQVKRRDDVYLPMPSGMLNAAAVAPDTVSNTQNNQLPDRADKFIDVLMNPNYHHNKPYQSYKTRAFVPDITSFTLLGLLGIGTRKEPTMEYPTSFKNWDDDYFLNLYRSTLAETIQTGRTPLILDIVNDEFEIHAMPAETLINWVEGERLDGSFGLTKLCFREEVPKMNALGLISGFENQYRIMYLDDDGIYTTALYDESYNLVVVPADATVTNPNQPNYRGKKLNRLPAVIVGSTNLDADPDIIPLGSVSAVAQQIYMKTADLSQSEFMACSPTLIFQGVDADQIPAILGSTVAIALPNPESKAYFTTTDTSALDHVQKHINDLYEQGAVFGANLLGGSRSSGESGEALRLRQTASSATLMSVVTTSGRGIEEMMEIAVEWSGASSADIMFEPPKELVDMVLDAQEMTALVSAFMGNLITKESVVNLFRRMGLLIDNRTVEEEMAALAEAGPVLLGGETKPGSEEKDDGSEEED